MKNLTIVIVTYRTPEKIILDCLQSIDSEIKVLIVENSENFNLKDKILSKFSNVEILCTGKNLGYGCANNYGISLAKTDYILILNPDVICAKDLFSNISDLILKTQDFSIIGCQYLHDDVFMPAGFFDKRKKFFNLLKLYFSNLWLLYFRSFLLFSHAIYSLFLISL